MHFGIILKELRTNRKLSQIDVSEKLKLSQTSISQIESGRKRPHPNTLKKLCKLYKVPVIYVVWKSVSEKDVEKNKIKVFRTLKPAIDAICEKLV